MENILIDTDVIIDLLLDRQPFSNDSTLLINLCENGIISGYVTPVMLSNIYYLLRKIAKHEKIIDSLKKLLNIVDIAIIDRKSVLNALNSEFKDFEDALQNYSNIPEKQIDVIITRNIKDYKTSKLSVMTPETYLKSLNI